MPVDGQSAQRPWGLCALRLQLRPIWTRQTEELTGNRSCKKAQFLNSISAVWHSIFDQRRAEWKAVVCHCLAFLTPTISSLLSKSVTALFTSNCLILSSIVGSSRLNSLAGLINQTRTE